MKGWDRAPCVSFVAPSRALWAGRPLSRATFCPHTGPYAPLEEVRAPRVTFVAPSARSGRPPLAECHVGRPAGGQGDTRRLGGADRPRPSHSRDRSAWNQPHRRASPHTPTPHCRPGAAPRASRAPARYVAAAIASSIASPGASTTLPWPGASRFGSSARSARAVASALAGARWRSTATGRASSPSPRSRPRRGSSSRRRRASRRACRGRRVDRAYGPGRRRPQAPPPAPRARACASARPRLRGSRRAPCRPARRGRGFLSFLSNRRSRAPMITSASGTAVCRASSEPMWSWCAWVSRIRAIGSLCRSAAATIPLAEPGIIVSITVRPPSSSTR